MFSPEDQQIEICLLKSNLEKIGDDLVVQNSVLPALDAENEQKCRETMTALRIARSLNAERERLNQENVRLTAKRTQLKRQCENITCSLERARGNRSELENLLKREEQEMELQIRKYEDSLREKAERFRKTRNYYNEDETRREIEATNSVFSGLEIQLESCKFTLEELTRQYRALRPDVPVNILEILCKPNLDEKIKNLVNKYKVLCEQRQSLQHFIKN